MHNINLIGEEEEEKEEEPQEEIAPEPPAEAPNEPSGFGSETISLETQEFIPEKNRKEPKLAEPVTPKSTSPPPDFSTYRRPQRSSRASVFLVLGFLVVVIAVVLFWQLQKEGGTETPAAEPAATGEVSQPGEQATEGTGTPAQQPAQQPPAGQQAAQPPAVTPQPPQDPSAFAAETAEITTSVVRVLQALPEDLNFTLISFTDDRFLIEYVGSTEAAALSFPEALSASLPVEDYRILARDRFGADGQTLLKVLLQGNVTPGSLGGAVTPPSEYMGVAAVRRSVSTLANSNGLTIRSVETRPDLVENGFELLPIDFLLAGKKSNAGAFLSALSTAGVNLRVGKVVLVSTDRRGLSDEEVNLALNANVYSPR